MNKAILKAIIDELQRQRDEDRANTPYLDLADIRDATVDGRVDLEALAGAVATAVDVDAKDAARYRGRGTLYAVQRLEAKVRSITHNWSLPAWYLKCDVANFFVAIDKRILAGLLEERIPEPWWRGLAELVLFHDPRDDVVVRGRADELALVPAHKRLGEQPPHRGLPIGNLSSQFFANVYLDRLDQFAKHQLCARHYVRYVDDFVLLHESRDWLAATLKEIAAFLPRELAIHLNDSKTVLQPVERGIDFAGQVIKPWHRRIRRRTFNEALSRVAAVDAEELRSTANSYFGLLRQATASHVDRAALARLVMKRGRAVNRNLTKTFSTQHQPERKP